MPSCLPPSVASWKSGPFPTLRCVVAAIIGTMSPADALSVPVHFASAYRTGPVHGYAHPLRRRRASRVPHVAFPASRSLYPRGFFAAASPSASRIPRPSPPKPGLGSPLSSSRRADLAGRQDSAISRTGCRFARRPQATLSRRFDAGISPARQPPATRLLGRYLGRACTGWSHGASSRYTR